MTITLSDFIINKIETAVLCSNQDTYEMQEIQEMIDNAIENYVADYPLQPTQDIPYQELSNMFARLQIQVI